MTTPVFDIISIQGSILDLQRRMELIDETFLRQSEVINNHAREQAVFSYRFDQAKRISDKLEDLVDRITQKGEDELRKTIEMIDRREDHLSASMQAHKELVLRDVALQHQTLKQSMDGLQKAVDELIRIRSQDALQFESIKKWMWGLMGALAVVSFFADKIISSLVG